MAKASADPKDETVADLRERAKEAGVSGTSHMRKDELVEALEHGGRNPAHDAAPRRPAGETSPDDVLALLKDDHDKVKALFKKALAKDASDPGIVDLVNEIVAELELHTQAEETIVYPALKDRAAAADADAAEDTVLEAYVEHGSVKELIARISSMSPAHESYKAVLTVMNEQVAHHVEEEESAMFKDARRLFGKDGLRSLGARVAGMKAAAAPAR